MTDDAEPTEQGPRNRFEIRILPDGSVVFVDLPGGWQKWRVLWQGSAPEMERPAEDAGGEDR